MAHSGEACVATAAPHDRSCSCKGHRGVKADRVDCVRIVHWLRNALAHVPPKQRPAVVALLRTIFAQDTAEAAHAQWRQVADTLRERFSRLADLMDGSRGDVLAYMAFPREHWARIASTNPLERLNGEIKRCLDGVASSRTSGP
jgi:transposase-like protein